MKSFAKHFFLQILTILYLQDFYTCNRIFIEIFNKNWLIDEKTHTQRLEPVENTSAMEEMVARFYNSCSLKNLN